MKVIKIIAFDEDGNEIGQRIQQHFDENMGASEYGIGLKAKELYRDYLFKNNLWENRTGYSRGTFWD